VRSNCRVQKVQGTAKGARIDGKWMLYWEAVDYFTVVQDSLDDAVLRIDGIDVRLELCGSSVCFRWPDDPALPLAGALQVLEDCTDSMLLWRASGCRDDVVRHFVWKHTAQSPPVALAFDNDSDPSEMIAKAACVLEGIWTCYQEMCHFEVVNGGCLLYDGIQACITFDDCTPVSIVRVSNNTVLQEVTEVQSRDAGGDVITWIKEGKKFLWVQQRSIADTTETLPNRSEVPNAPDVKGDSGTRASEFKATASPKENNTPPSPKQGGNICPGSPTQRLAQNLCHPTQNQCIANAAAALLKKFQVTPGTAGLCPQGPRPRKIVLPPSRPHTRSMKNQKETRPRTKLDLQLPTISEVESHTTPVGPSALATTGSVAVTSLPSHPATGRAQGHAHSSTRSGPDDLQRKRTLAMCAFRKRTEQPAVPSSAAPRRPLKALFCDDCGTTFYSAEQYAAAMDIHKEHDCQAAEPKEAKQRRINVTGRDID